MLAQLSIRDIVLIDRLDLSFREGLSVLTGETGAGKSILLDAFAMTLGARGDAALVRQGAEQGQVTAAFELSRKHPARALLKESGIDADDDLIVRRVQFADGRTKAFVNDQPVSVQMLKSLGEALVGPLLGLGLGHHVHHASQHRLRGELGDFDFEQGLAVQRVIDAALRSHNERRWVDL